MNGLQTSQLNRAIAHGAEEGMFALPKGPSGKVKLAPKAKAATATKEVRVWMTFILVLCSCEAYAEHEACSSQEDCREEARDGEG